MNLLARLILLAAMYSTHHYYGSSQVNQYQGPYITRGNSYSWSAPAIDPIDPTYRTFCYQSANLYLFREGNDAINYWIMSNTTVLESCIVYHDYTADYLTIYLSGTSQGNDSYTVGIDISRMREPYSTIYKTLPITY